MNFGANDCIIGVICGQNGVMSRRMLPHLRGFCPIFEAEALFREAGQLKIRGQQAAIFFDFFFPDFRILKKKSSDFNTLETPRSLQGPPSWPKAGDYRNLTDFGKDAPKAL